MAKSEQPDNFSNSVGWPAATERIHPVHNHISAFNSHLMTFISSYFGINPPLKELQLLFWSNLIRCGCGSAKSAVTFKFHPALFTAPKFLFVPVVRIGGVRFLVCEWWKRVMYVHCYNCKDVSDAIHCTHTFTQKTHIYTALLLAIPHPRSPLTHLHVLTAEDDADRGPILIICYTTIHQPES